MDAIVGTTTRYYYDDQRIALQTSVSGGTETDQKYFIFGNYIDEVLLMSVIPAQAGIQDFYYGHDHLYSPTALFESDGDVVERYEYDVYGSVRILSMNYDLRTISSYANPYYFTGRELDSMDGGSCKIMYYRARSYDPQTGRFLQRDPLWVFEYEQEDKFSPVSQYNDGMLLYEYVKARPLYLLDPDGKCSFFAEGSMRSKRKLWKPGLLGETWIKEWKLSTKVEKCKDSCQKKIILKKCSALVGYWFVYTGPDGFTLFDLEGNDPLHHERHHVDQIHEYWNELVGIVNSVANVCMTEKQAYCFRDALSLYAKAYKTGAYMAGYRWDSQVYPPATDESTMEHLRELADDYTQKWREQINTADRKWNECLSK